MNLADTIIQMDRYIPREITETAKEAAREYPGLELPEKKGSLPGFDRRPGRNPGILHKGRIKVKTLGRDGFQLNHETVDLRYVEQLATRSS